MINKTIHYVWFGGKPLTKEMKKNISSWRKYCPDYKIIEWNETNFDVNQNAYTKEAYENKKWAFVSDYVRLYVLYHYGGIYMDTDVEVLKNLDKYLVHDAFSGFESNSAIPTGIIGAKKGNIHIKNLLNEYDQRHFVLENNELDLTTNVTTITNYFIKKDIILNNTKQNCEGFVFYPSEFFCPKDYRNGKIHLTENTVTIHHFNGSWVPKRKKIKYAILNRMNKKVVIFLVRTKSVLKHIIK